MDDDELGELPGLSCPVRVIRVARHADGALPLARARNAVAEEAAGPCMIFLDVDCIPAPDLVAGLAAAVGQTAGAVMGEVAYLPEGAADEDWTFASLDATASPHPRRPRPSPGAVEPTDAYHLLWTLCVAMSKASFARAGGLDEGYRGYGAEDTDLAFRLRRADIPFALAGYRVYHQWHPVYRPPLNHFGAIVRNAERFHAQWSTWPMEGWLAQFANLGLLRWPPLDEAIHVVREPTAAEVSAALQEGGYGY